MDGACGLCHWSIYIDARATADHPEPPDWGSLMGVQVLYHGVKRPRMVAKMPYTQ